MSLPVLLLLIGFVYIVVFGGLALLRREGLSLRFALESLILTGVVAGLTAVSSFKIEPVVFLLLLYLVTMRVRLLVDLGTDFARRGKIVRAGRFYEFAARLWPDQSGMIVIDVNRATALLQSGQYDLAISLLKSVLDKAGQGYLGVKYEVAAHYNLAVAYLRQKKDSQAIIEFNAVLDTWPSSDYSRSATRALEKLQHKNLAEKDNQEE